MRRATAAPAAARESPRFDPSIACFLEEIYIECDRPERLGLDPLAVAKRYEVPADIEVAGFVCSMLAFGSVELIIRACEGALEPLGERPAKTLVAMSDEDIARSWSEFQYRFCFPRDMIGVMWALRTALREYGSLEALFLDSDISDGTNAASETSAIPLAARARTTAETDAAASIIPSASRFVRRLRRWSEGITPGGLRKNLLPDPTDGSASKRLFLFLRWMIRRDYIDPGCWCGLSPSRLIVPMDTHMIRTCADRLGFLEPRGAAAVPTATLRDAIRVTETFRLYAPEDPVKFDFALTRPGIDPWPGDERFGCL